MPNIIKNEDSKALQQGSIDLLVEHYSNSARTLQIRGLTENNLIIADMATSTDRSLVSTVIDITSIPIFLTARASVTGVKRGELYVKVFLRIDGVISALLFCGYVSDNEVPNYPNGKNEGSLEGPGLIRSITGTDPAAGVEISETVPTRVLWRLISARMVLVTDATVASRNRDINIDDGANILIQISTITAQVASSNWGITFADLGTPINTNSLGRSSSIPAEVFVQAGWRIKSITSNLQAADDFQAPQLLVEEWIQT